MVKSVFDFKIILALFPTHSTDLSIIHVSLITTNHTR
jgi:hypothetical protein